MIGDLLSQYPTYHSEPEPYFTLYDDGFAELALEPSLDALIEQLSCSISQIDASADDPNFIFDRCPIDFLAYALCTLEQDAIDIHDSEISEFFPEIKDALDSLDYIVFLPLCPESPILYSEENPAYRARVNDALIRILRDQPFDIFPRYDHPRVIEISGTRQARVDSLKPYFCG